MKTYVAVVRDHSASMSSVKSHAQTDYNNLIKSIQETAQSNIVTTIRCGIGTLAKNEIEIVNVDVNSIKPISDYPVSGMGTPLFDAVDMAITELSNNVSVKDFNDPTTAYLVMVITDGQDNRSSIKAHQLADKIKTLQGTDKWTFVFRVPNGDKNALIKMGIPEGNIMEWEVSSKGFQHATQVTTNSVGDFYSLRSSGATSTRKFFADTTNLSRGVVNSVLTDITPRIRAFVVPTEKNGIQIRDFCQEYFGGYVKGAAYYQLTKSEEVQAQKEMVVRDRGDMKFYGGDDARSLLGLTSNGTIRLHPGNLSKYDVFVQSTSVNRKLVAGTTVLYV